MYRYMFVLVDEGQRLMRAREARSADLAGQRSGGSLLWRARVTGDMIGTLFLRTYERSERIYQAMLARGYTGEFRALGQREVKRREFALSGAGLLLLACVALLARVYG
jgi:cobalt/nickel transport system permease protein